MPKKWTGELVALLHDYKITQNALRVAFALPLTGGGGPRAPPPPAPRPPGGPPPPPKPRPSAHPPSRGGGPGAVLGGRRLRRPVSGHRSRAAQKRFLCSEAAARGCCKPTKTARKTIKFY